MPDNVKCADCGFLAVRHFQTRELMDAEHDLRVNGAIRRIMLFPGREESVYEEYPVCFANAIIFRDDEEMGTQTNPAKRAECINKQRNCGKFTTWRQGFTPKAHQEMIWSEESLKIQRETHAAELKWREDQADRDHKWRKEEAAWRKKELWVMGVIVTLVSVAAQIASAFIERGDLFKSKQSDSHATLAK